MKIQLTDVGRAKVIKTIEIPDGSSIDQIEVTVIKEAKKHLVSSDVDTTWNGEKGEIFVGVHAVGRFTVVK